MRIRLAGLLLLAVVLPAGAQDKKVDTAIERGVAWLRSQQAGDGSWGGLAGKRGLYRYPAGPTSLALFALLASGVPPDDLQIKRGFDYVGSYYRVPGSTYEIAFLMLAPSASAQDDALPKLGDHLFVPVTALAEPFITTFVDVSMGMGWTMMTR